MKLHKNWLYLVVLLLIASFLLVACERPLPGGYNDPEAGTDTTEPEVPGDVPGIDSEGYPAEEAPAAPEEAAPVDTESYPADAVEAYPAEEGVEEQAIMGEGEEAAPEGEEAAPEGEEAAAADEEAAEAEAPAEEAAAEGAAEETAETPGTHTVAEGENLYRIGLLYGISWLDLAEANGIVDPANLSVGQVLTIPSAESLAEAVEETSEEAQTAVAEEATDEAEAEEAPAEETDTSETEVAEETTEDAETEEAEASDTEAAEAEEPPADEAAATEEATEEAEEAPAEEAAADDGTRTYVVQAGDNLFRIGVNHGVDWTVIAATNGIVDASIYPGMELIIPAAEDAEAEAEATDDADAAAEEAEAGEAEAAGEETTYVVQEGDSIYSVAFEHGIPWTAIVEANDIEAPYTLEVGQTLIIIAPASGE